jgi:SAM-dependent methyltransferase/uncharacterized protein YbaR (Trm112 family)
MILRDRLLPGLICPITRRLLRLDRAIDERNGLLAGGAVPYPVLDGIPRLLDDPARVAIVSLIDAGALDDALRIALSWPDKRLGNRVRRKLAGAALRIAPTRRTAQRLAAGLSTGTPLTETAGSVEEMLRRLDSGFFIDWLLHRFSARTFRPLEVLARYVPEGARVLDLGGGFGHGAWVLCGRTPPSRITLVDAVFSHLFVARRRMVPGLQAVACDLAHGPPFEGAAFDAIVMSDTLHFVEDPRACIERAARVLASQGRMLVSQIHNGDVLGPFTGAARSPDGYLALFDGMHPRLLENAAVLRALGGATPLGPKAERTPADLRGIAEISLIADHDGAGLGAPQAPAGPARHAQLSSLLVADVSGALIPLASVSPVVEPFLTRPRTNGWTVERARAAVDPRSPDHRGALAAGILIDAPPRYRTNGGWVPSGDATGLPFGDAGNRPPRIV